MTAPIYDVVALGNAIVDVIAPADDDFLAAHGLIKGSMGLVEEARAEQLHARMTDGVETSGGSAANTIAGVVGFGGRAAYCGKVANDRLGDLFGEDLRASGATYRTAPLVGGPGTGRSMIAVTPDGQRTMSTFLGASSHLGLADVDEDLITQAATVYLEGYLFDPPDARAAFGRAAGAARDAGRTIALSLSDSFVVERRRDELRAFLSQVDVLFANEAEACVLTGEASFEAATSEIARLVGIAVITRGAQGATVVADGESTHVEASATDEVIDTTGAGDQFAAGFLFGLARGRSLRLCAQLGALAACEVIGHYGARPQASLEDLARAQGLI